MFRHNCQKSSFWFWSKSSADAAEGTADFKVTKW